MLLIQARLLRRILLIMGGKIKNEILQSTVRNRNTCARKALLLASGAELYQNEKYFEQSKEVAYNPKSWWGCILVTRATSFPHYSSISFMFLFSWIVSADSSKKHTDPIYLMFWTLSNKFLIFPWIGHKLEQSEWCSINLFCYYFYLWNSHST